MILTLLALAALAALALAVHAHFAHRSFKEAAAADLALLKDEIAKLKAKLASR